MSNILCRGNNFVVTGSLKDVRESNTTTNRYTDDRSSTLFVDITIILHMNGKLVTMPYSCELVNREGSAFFAHANELRQWNVVCEIMETFGYWTHSILTESVGDNYLDADQEGELRWGKYLLNWMQASKWGW